MEYRYLGNSGVLSESAESGDSSDAALLAQMRSGQIPLYVVELVPESVCRENRAMPIGYDGETLAVAVADPDDIALADKLRFLLAVNVRFVKSSKRQIQKAIDRHYPHVADECSEAVLNAFTDTAIDYTETVACDEIDAGAQCIAMPARQKQDLSSFSGSRKRSRPPYGGEEQQTPQLAGASGMFHYVIEEGQRVLLRRWDGTMTIVSGPRRLWKGWSTFEPMQRFVAHPGGYLIVRYCDGRQEHLPGPADVWFDRREHLSVEVEDGLQIADKEAVVVYGRQEETITRRIVYGPAMFIPQPGEWLHRFSWHSSTGGSRGVAKKPNSLVFHKLWLMPDQMYHDVQDVRTADDAVLTIRLMVFFELVDIERMLNATHDPIGDMVNAATSDVVDFTGRHDFDSFKQNTDKLNDLQTYTQLTARATQCGYKISNVVYRGYGAPEPLQRMHNQAIEARTQLQLDRATEEQTQHLEDFKLESQLARSAKRRSEQAEEVRHDIGMAAERAEAERKDQQATEEIRSAQQRADFEMREEFRHRQDVAQQEHLRVLREMEVDLTEFLTQGRADQVIEMRGGKTAHLHLEGQRAQHNGAQVTG